MTSGRRAAPTETKFPTSSVMKSLILCAMHLVSYRLVGGTVLDLVT